MDSQNDSDLSNQNVLSTSAEDPLQNFVEGLSEKMWSELGRVSTAKEKREVKREIARELGIERVYVPQAHSSVNDSEDTSQARYKVRSRYNDLLSEGKVVEVGEVDAQTKRTKEWNERLNAHLRGEDCFHSEDHPHADWPLEEP